MLGQSSWWRLRRVFRRELGPEVDEELQHHLEQRVRDYIGRGMDPEAARNAALERLGDLEHVRNECIGLLAAERRAEERRMLLRVSWLDVKLGLRMLVKHPGLSLVAGLGMTVAIAITTGFFAFFYAYAYPKLPLEEGDRIVALENWDLAVDNEERHSLHDFVMWRAEMKSVVEISAFRDVESRAIASDELPAVVKVAKMTASGFGLARVPALLGRHLLEEDERDGAPAVVVIGYDVWRTRFGQSRSVIGEEVRIGEKAHTIVGVMPEGFGFPLNHQSWTPLRANPSDYARGEGPEIFIFGRLAPGATIETARAELMTIGQRAAISFPETHAELRPQVWPYVWPLMEIQGGGGVGWFDFQLMITLVLVVVALNIAVLVYARTATRQGEIAVRTALGASRSRIVTQLFVEALVLAVGPALLGLWVAHVVGVRLGGRILEHEIGGAPFWTDYGVRPGTVLYTMGLVVLAAAIMGVLPALQATGRRIQSDIRQLGGGTGMRLGRLWTALIVAQVAIAVAALPNAVQAGLSQIEGALTRPTFPVDEFLTAVLTMEKEPGLAADTSGQDVMTSSFGGRVPDLMQRLRAEPDIVGVTFVSNLLGRTGTVRVEADSLSAPTRSPSGYEVRSIGVGPRFLDVLGARILAGRGFESRDVGHAAGTVIVNRSFVRNVLGGGNAVGRRIRYRTEPGAGDSGEAEPGRWYEIVGVAADLYANPIAPELVPVMVYNPVAPARAPGASLALLLRLRGSASRVDARTLGAIAAEVDPALQLVQVQRGANGNPQMQRVIRLVAFVLLLVVATVLVLSAAGVYALMSFTVSQRRKEIGIRSALGASPYRVLMSLFSRVASQVGVGVVVGIAGAILLERFTGDVTTSARAPLVVPAIALLMVVVGFFAAFGPARQGLKIDPSEALRAEQ